MHLYRDNEVHKMIKGHHGNPNVIVIDSKIISK